jgi:hypothetical protein
MYYDIMLSVSLCKKSEDGENETCMISIFMIISRHYIQA